MEYSVDGTFETETTEGITSHGSSGGSGLISGNYEPEWAANTSNIEDDEFSLRSMVEIINIEDLDAERDQLEIVEWQSTAQIYRCSRNYCCRRCRE